MKRRLALTAIAGSVVLAACGAKQAPAAPELPVSVGDWSRATLDVKDASDAPEPARTLEAKSWTSSRYESGGKTVIVDAFTFGFETLAFEAQQKWQRGNGVTSFYRGNAFAVCASDQIGMPELVQFARQLETLWLGSNNQ